MSDPIEFVHYKDVIHSVDDIPNLRAQVDKYDEFLSKVIATYPDEDHNFRLGMIRPLADAYRKFIEPPTEQEILNAIRKIITDANSAPPPVAELLATALLPQKRREAILGDLEERFSKDVALYGISRAKLRYCGNVASLLRPMAVRFVKRVRTFALLEAVRHLFFG